MSIFSGNLLTVQKERWLDRIMDQANELSTTALVLVAAVGGVGALLGSLLTAVSNGLLERGRRRYQHSLWVKEKQHSEYSSVMIAASHLHRLSVGFGQDLADAAHDLRVAVERALLVTPQLDADRLRLLATDFLKEVQSSSPDNDALTRLGREMRSLMWPYVMGLNHKPR